MTAVIHAVRSGTSEDLARLVHRGEEVNRHDINGYTALHSACERCKLNELNLLLEYNANVNHPTKASFFFIFLQSAKSGFVEGVIRLIESYANLEAVDKHGLTPLLVGCREGKSEVEGHTALYYVISNGMDSSIDLLLRAGARVNTAGKGGKTAAHYAAEQGWCNALRRIAIEGADFNIRNWRGCGALHYAALRGNIESAMVLVENGADVDLEDYNGATPLINACRANQYAMVSFLLEQNADINRQNKISWMVQIALVLSKVSPKIFNYEDHLNVWNSGASERVRV
ncbi:unnamed protein product [Hymenolepis diminuta]|uniref:ANK_REP_REGION domain-containing protein n=1 Tax=Hymenolepis diminuta TaxID=6216 RepID=A0A0R3SBZ1_HYMDI|nr:unnamed protein product [Hymenolepis diminuta]